MALQKNIVRYTSTVHKRSIHYYEINKKVCWHPMIEIYYNANIDRLCIQIYGIIMSKPSLFIGTLPTI